MRGRAYCGYCAAKKEKFFGWRLHVVCTDDGVPVAFDMLPASEHDLTPIHETDGQFTRRRNRFSATRLTFQAMMPAPFLKTVVCVWYRSAAKTCFRILGQMISTCGFTANALKPFIVSFRLWVCSVLHARTNAGFDVKAYASLLALAFTNILV